VLFGCRISYSFQTILSSCNLQERVAIYLLVSSSVTWIRPMASALVLPRELGQE
jgi:hypothetical protein